jgi:hypothetical protein
VKAVAYLNHNRWVADCPAPGCTDARAVYPEDQSGIPSPVRLSDQVCAFGHAFTIDMPPVEVEAQINAAMAERISKWRRNWFPRNHPRAISSGRPHGQSIRELREETEAGEAADAEALAAKRAALLAQMRELGVTPDEALSALKGV